jgi:hypothetical protein
MRENMKFTLDLADKLLRSAGKDTLDAFMKAVGTRAQVIHIITPDDQSGANIGLDDEDAANIFGGAGRGARPKLSYHPKVTLQNPRRLGKLLRPAYADRATGGDIGHGDIPCCPRVGLSGRHSFTPSVGITTISLHLARTENSRST